MSSKVSLILTTYNNLEFLKKTLDSIETQDYPNIEVVIKDGGSTDGTIECIEAFANKHNDAVSSESGGSEPRSSAPGITVVYASSPDTGIYDAMNQGIQMSSGDIIACFNDKFLCADAISKLVKAMNETNPATGQAYDGVHADLVYADGDKVIRTWKMGQGNIRTGWMPGHPTLYLRRSIYDEYGLYDTSFKIAADYEFMIRFLSKGIALNYVPETLISMYYSGTSTSSLGSYIKSYFEGVRAMKINKIKFAYTINVLRTFRVLSQF